jgi:hypothetical protein
VVVLFLRPTGEENMSIYKTRRALYRTASLLADAQAVQQSVQQRSARPAAKRAVRYATYRTEAHYTRRILRGLGI